MGVTERMIKVLAPQRALASESEALRREVGPQWSAEASTIDPKAVEAVEVHVGRRAPTTDPLIDAVAWAEQRAAAVVAAPLGSIQQRAEVGLLETAFGGVLRECVVAGERLRLILERYVVESRKIEESTGERPPELTSAELLSSLLGRWAEERGAVQARGASALVDSAHEAEQVKLANKAMARALTSIAEVVCGDTMDLRKLTELVGDLACRANESRDLINAMRAQLGDQLALHGIEAAPEVMHEVAARVMADERVMLASIRELLKPQGT